MNDLVTCTPFPHITGTPEVPRLCRLSDLLSDWERDAQAAYTAQQTGVPRGPLTGFAALDRELGGALAPGIHIVHGQPGTGKTAFALQIAASCRYPALYLTAEMTPLELLRRLTARASGVYLGRLKSGELTPAQSLDLAKKAIAASPDLIFIDGTQSFASPEWIREVAEVCRETHEHLLLVVDSIHSWAEGAMVEATEYDALNAALASLRTLATALNCPVLVVAERNRASMKQGGLSAGAGTRKIEYAAETVLDLERNGRDLPTADSEVPVTVKIAKNRHGAAGKELDFLFHGALQRFKEA
ncbi:MAG TPA: DnaB-like helicase C-terminal domain-containing protein [Armatimonadota bacterium]|nr:DnaB-like helicase C-terminal domain-containing protein [Armatimonadota bacterium]